MAMKGQADIQALYDRCRFLDAYRASESAWQDPAAVAGYDVEELILGGRLARRLGSPKISRWLFRTALERSPDHPAARYYGRFSIDVRASLLDRLRQAQQEPDLPDAPPGIRASWLIATACLCAQARDFDQAFALADRAQSFNQELAWIKICRAWILFAADRWDEALRAAEEAWELAPGAPASAQVLGTALTRCGRIADAAERLTAAAADCQSYEVTITAIYYGCAHAERCFPDGLEAWGRRVRELSCLLEDRAPIADRTVQRWFDWIRNDIALLLADHGALIQSRRDRNNTGFYNQVCENIQANPKAGRTVIPCTGVLQKHNTCLPSSVATVVSAMEHTIDADDLAARLTYGGTSTWRAAEWLRREGYAVRFAVFCPELARGLLGAGIPFVVVQVWDGGAHAMAAIGLDEAAGTLLVHDPGGLRWRHILMDHVADEESPIGPGILAVVPAKRAAELERLIPDEANEVSAAQTAYDRVCELEGVSSAGAVLQSLGERHPDHPITLHLKAQHASLSGDLAEATQAYEALAKAYPQNVILRQSLVSAHGRTGNTARLRETLRTIVEQFRVPGVEAQQEWIFPPSIYVARYADLISASAEYSSQAERLLQEALRRSPHCGETYHILADVYSRSARHEAAVLPYRIAALLVEENDHYARAAADALRRNGSDTDGLTFLRRRAERLSNLDLGLSAWATYVDAADDYGHPHMAQEALRFALAQRRDPEVLLPFACRFWARHGQWEDADRVMETLAASDAKLHYLGALTDYQCRRGDWRKALDTCRQWLDESPASLTARRYWLDLVARRDGRAAARKIAQDWVEAQPGHDDVEEMLLDQLDAMGEFPEGISLLQERVRRNADDAWAWRELGHRCLNRMDELPANDPQQEIWEQRFREATEACRRTCPDNPATLFLNARRLEAQLEISGAIQVYLDALYIDPEYAYAYRRVCSLLAQVEEALRDPILDNLEAAMLRIVGPPHTGYELASRIVRYRGLEATLRRVERWQALLGRAPELIETQALLLLENGEGRSDARRAADVLQQGIREFPAHVALRIDLARVWSELLEEEQAAETWKEILRLRPTHNRARFELSALLEHENRDDEAMALLEQAVTIDPLDIDAWSGLARHLWTHSQPLESVDALRRGLRQLPEDVNLRETLIYRLVDLGRGDEAVQVARDGLEIHPRGAYCWYLLGNALSGSTQHTDAREIETAYRTALDFNAGLFDAADELAVTLAGYRRFGEACEVIESIRERLDDPSPARGRLAWLLREEGKRPEAIAAMAEVVRGAPWYAWGWDQLMRWIKADSDRDSAEAWLLDWPDVLQDEARLRAQRLEILAEVNLIPKRLDDEWHDLLHDFPRNVQLHLQRFDLLWEADRRQDAAEVLQASERFHGGNRYLLARKTQVLAWQGHRDQALEAALQVWLQPSNADWPDRTAWQALRDYKWHKAGAERVLSALRDDYRPSPTAFELALHCETATTAETHTPPRGWLRARFIVNPAVRRLWRVLKDLDDRSWDAAQYRAIVISTLDCLGYQRLILRLWKRHQESWNAQTPVWQQVAHACLPVSRRWARKLLAEWPQRPGAQMFIVANYTLALRGGPREGSPKDRLKIIFETSQAALRRLEPDWTARYVACNYCETALRLRRYEAFLEGMDAYRGYLEMPAEDTGEFYLNNSYRGTPEVLIAFDRLLRAVSPDQAFLQAADIAMIQTLRKHAHPAPSWVITEWFHYRRTRTAFPPSDLTYLRWKGRMFFTLR